MPDLLINQNLDIQERGLHYGDGLFETLLKLNGEIPLWAGHYDRLQRGCNKLQIPVPGESWLFENIASETAGQDSIIVKVIVTRGGGGRGLSLPQHKQVSVFVLQYPFKAIDDNELEMDVSICQTRLPINPNLAGIKHLNRLDYVLAAIELEAKGGKDEAILCDTDGYLVEGIISNLFFNLHGEIYTPGLELAGVAGIMRQQILNYLQDQGIAVHIGRYYPDLLLQCSECFLCNSVHRVRPVRAIDDTRFATGPITQMLIQVFNLNRNTVSDPAG